ncbi:unnamed protein product [Ectocarpus sp. CCAP 1310/34]|nr:unnamed protein product [Ectocarpus sp. CCAP 1310/34]
MSCQRLGRPRPTRTTFKHAPITKIKNDKGEVVSYAIAERTARSWLHKLGCEYRDTKSGLYFDGHDREDDVLEFRVETYLPAYFEHRDYTEIWIDASLEKARSWEVETQPRDRKEDGRVWGMMISGTIVGDVGFVEGTQADINKAQELRRERCRISREKKHAAGDPTRPEKYRDIEILYFEGEGDDRKFSTYQKFEYGKNKAGMNAGYGGARKGQEMAPQDATTILEDTPKLKKGAAQFLTFQAGEYPFHEPGATDQVGKIKGLKQVLFERGLWIPGMSMTGAKKGQKAILKTSMPAVLRGQKDFAKVDSSLEVLLKRHGGVALMLPKFHFELNQIELVWRRKVANFHTVYNAGLEGAEAVQEHKKFMSHRKPAPSEYIKPK